jgi:uncharacterized membrane protein YqjE
MEFIILVVTACAGIIILSASGMMSILSILVIIHAPDKRMKAIFTLIVMLILAYCGFNMYEIATALILKTI